MPEEKQDIKQKPSRSYRFDLVINKLDYANDLKRIQIVNSITNGYPVITLDLALDPSDIILDRIYGKEPMKLSIKLIGRGQEDIPLESIEMELMYVQGAENIPQTENNVTEEKEPKQRVLISFMTICRQAFITMTCNVNEIIEKMTPKEAIEMLVGKYTKAELVYDTDGLNTDKIDQLLIPKGTLYSSINLIDSNFGLFNGSSNFGGYCQYDNKLYISNLTKKITKDYDFIVHHLSTNSEATKKIIEDSIDGKTFYTYGQLKSDYSGNTKFAGMGGTITHILKPFSKLFSKQEINLQDFAKEFGAVFKGQNIDVDIGAKRKVYKTDLTGDGTESTTAIKARLARDIIGLATVTFQLEKNLPIIPLMKVGNVVKLDTKTVTYVDLTGKYLLKSSHLVFEKNANDWTSVATLTIMRTNKTI